MRKVGAGPRYGFWTGVFAGLAVSVCAVVVLALVFPPPPPIPPALAPEAAEAPAGPAAPRAEPDGTQEAEPARALIRTQSPGPLIADRQGAEMPAGLEGPAPARDIFEGQQSGSPSLVPRDTQ